MFSPYFQASENSFAPLFRLLDDFETYNRELGPREGTHRRGVSSPTIFTPKFDYRETEESFELHGELPGINKENVNIDFTGPQTLIVKGRVERSYESGTPPAGYVTAGETMSGAITEKGEGTTKSHKATVEDAGENGDLQKQVSKEKTEQTKREKSKYWYSERSVGEFSRTFNFPTTVDQDNVKASLKEGILNISVPKARKPTSRRIAIQ